MFRFSMRLESDENHRSSNGAIDKRKESKFLIFLIKGNYRLRFL